LVSDDGRTQHPAEATMTDRKPLDATSRWSLALSALLTALGKLLGVFVGEEAGALLSGFGAMLAAAILLAWARRGLPLTSTQRWGIAAGTTAFAIGEILTAAASPRGFRIVIAIASTIFAIAVMGMMRSRRRAER
jgi:hypothetical protein